MYPRSTLFSFSAYYYGCVWQVDVIEAQYALLKWRTAGARDFKEVERAHQAYLDALLSQCFLDMRQIGQMLEAVFTLCQRLCTYIQVRMSYIQKYVQEQ
jgi:hypothetical protein